MAAALLPVVLKRHQPDFHSVVPFDPARDRLYPFDFTENNTELPPEQIAETERFAAYINRTLQNHQTRYGFGGFWEQRTLYAHRKQFLQPTTPQTAPIFSPQHLPPPLHPRPHQS